MNDLTTERMREVGQNMCQTHAYMGPPPEGSTVWIGNQLLLAADEIERLRDTIAQAVVIILHEAMPSDLAAEWLAGVITKDES